MVKHILLSGALAAAIICPAHAVTLVDTGTPTAGRAILGSGQQLAGRFTLAAPTTITAFDGYFVPTFPSFVTARLYSGGDTPDEANLLFIAPFISSGVEGWSGVSQLAWAVSPGDYWLAFEGNDRSLMRVGPPNPLQAYAFTGTGGWINSPHANIGIRVFGDLAGVVPEPGTWLLLIIGFGTIGAGMRLARVPSRTSARSA